MKTVVLGNDLYIYDNREVNMEIILSGYGKEPNTFKINSDNGSLSDCYLKLDFSAPSGVIEMTDERKVL